MLSIIAQRVIPTLRFPGALRVAAADDDTAAEVEEDGGGESDVEDMVG